MLKEAIYLIQDENGKAKTIFKNKTDVSFF